MNILITAPSLDVTKNVSGISAVVNTIIENNTLHTYHHFVAGNEDGNRSIVKRLLQLLKSYTSLARLYKTKGVQLVHLNLAMNPKSMYRDYLIFLISTLYKIPVVVHLHGGMFLLKKPTNIVLKNIAQRMLTSARAVICLSPMEKDFISNQYSLPQVKVLQNTVSGSYFQLNKTIDYSGNINVLFMGRLHESKGIRVILEAISKLLEDGHLNLCFVFCGAGPLESEVMQFAGLHPDNVQYRGIAAGIRKAKILGACHLFILPSLYGEGLPVALIEAMASGLVPVVTNDGSMKTFIKDGETGFFVDKGSARQICRTLVELIGNIEKIRTVSFNARKFITDNFAIDSYIDSLSNIYTTVLTK